MPLRDLFQTYQQRPHQLAVPAQIPVFTLADGRQSINPTVRYWDFPERRAVAPVIRAASDIPQFADALEASSQMGDHVMRHHATRPLGIPGGFGADAPRRPPSQFAPEISNRHALGLLGRYMVTTGRPIFHGPGLDRMGNARGDRPGYSTLDFEGRFNGATPIGMYQDIRGGTAVPTTNSRFTFELGPRFDLGMQPQDVIRHLMPGVADPQVRFETAHPISPQYYSKGGTVSPIYGTVSPISQNNWSNSNTRMNSY